ncbi:MAG: hypothetical protein QOJ98_961 [Acidobacteriota bacterium]|nr:hypothetical protein [Acidobacteriota bacterium]
MTSCFCLHQVAMFAIPQAPPTPTVIPSVERGTWVGGDAQDLRVKCNYRRTDRFLLVPALVNSTLVV